MNHLVAFNNTMTAGTITLILARVFGKHRVVTDDMGTMAIYQWCGVDYVFDFKLNPDIYSQLMESSLTSVKELWWSSGSQRCYQCDAPVSYLFADSRCVDCTRV